MATIAVLGEKEEARRELILAIEELGHRVASAGKVRDAVELLSDLRPQLLVVACPPGSRLAEHMLGEVDRVQPLLPVIVALERRNAARAVDLMRAGAYEVLAPPWSPDNFSAALAKALRFKGTAYALSPPLEERRRVDGFFGIVLGFLVLAGGYQLLKPKPKVRPPPAPVTRVWELPYSHPAGLAFFDGELWATDWFSQTVYRLDPKTLAVRRAMHYPKETPTAVALTKDALWTAGASRVLVRHVLDERLTAVARVADRAGPTVAMAYDGLYLWTADAKRKKLYKRIMDDALTVVDAYDYPGAEPAALAWDGKSLWSVDAGNKELLRHGLDHPGRVTLRVSLPEYQDGDFRPVGLAWDGERFWTAAECRRSTSAPGRVIRHVFGGRAP